MAAKRGALRWITVTRTPPCKVFEKHRSREAGAPTSLRTTRPSEVTKTNDLGTGHWAPYGDPRQPTEIYGDPRGGGRAARGRNTPKQSSRSDGPDWSNPPLLLSLVLILSLARTERTHLAGEDGVGQDSGEVGGELGGLDPCHRAPGHVGHGSEVLEVAGVAVHGDDLDRDAVLDRLFGFAGFIGVGRPRGWMTMMAAPPTTTDGRRAMIRRCVLRGAGGGGGRGSAGGVSARKGQRRCAVSTIANSLRSDLVR